MFQQGPVSYALEKQKSHFMCKGAVNTKRGERKNKIYVTFKVVSFECYYRVVSILDPKQYKEGRDNKKKKNDITQQRNMDFNVYIRTFFVVSMFR